MPSRLPQDFSETFLQPRFFAKDSVTVARALLGQVLVQHDTLTGERRRYRIVETEAYRADDDPACHAHGRRTGRAATLFKTPGLAYVYLIYGMYHCLNVVTEPEGRGGAVLFRALEPLDSTDLKTSLPNTRGPGRLTRALGITRETHNELPMTRSDSGLYLVQGEKIPDAAIVQTTRIGISKAADFPWRFYLRENPWVSVI